VNAPPLTRPGQRSATTLSIELESEGRRRSAIVHVPAMPAGTEAPLLVVLHGAGSSAARFEAKTGFDQLADEDRFIVAYPDGIAVGSSRTWNAGRCCPPASATGVDDVAFVVALLDRLEATYPVDVRRVYAVGHSNGAMLAQRLGCEESRRFVAVASVAGSLELPGCAPRPAVAMLEIHGTADRQVPMSAALAAVRVWRRADRCATERNVTVAGPVMTETWRCVDGTDVRSVQIAGADHPWPGGRTPPPTGQHASDALDASLVAWSFLSSHTRES